MHETMQKLHYFVKIAFSGMQIFSIFSMEYWKRVVFLAAVYLCLLQV